MDKNINKRVRQCRNLAGLTQAQTAEKMGMNCSTYSQMEREGDITGSRLVELAKIFGVTPEVFLSEEPILSDAKPVNYSEITDTKTKEPDVLRQSSRLISEDFSPVFIPTKNEENLIKVIRNLPKDLHDEVILFIEEQYKKSRKK